MKFVAVLEDRSNEGERWDLRAELTGAQRGQKGLWIWLLVCEQRRRVYCESALRKSATQKEKLFCDGSQLIGGLHL